MIGFLRALTRLACTPGWRLITASTSSGFTFSAADIDDAAAPPDEMIAVAAQLDHVAGVDEAVGVAQGRRIVAEIAQRRAVGADAQRAVDDLHRDAVAALAEKGGGKARAAVVDLEADAGFGRGIGMGDARARIERRQGVEHGLVGDLAGQAHIVRDRCGAPRGSSAPAANATACRKYG